MSEDRELLGNILRLNFIKFNYSNQANFIMKQLGWGYQNNIDNRTLKIA